MTIKTLFKATNTITYERDKEEQQLSCFDIDNLVITIQIFQLSSVYFSKIINVHRVNFTLNARKFSKVLKEINWISLSSKPCQIQRYLLKHWQRLQNQRVIGLTLPQFKNLPRTRSDESISSQGMKRPSSLQSNYCFCILLSSLYDR